jgi:hypothetical protein
MPQVTPFAYQTFNPWRRLREIGMFFQSKDPVHQALRRLVRRLDKAGIAYCVMGAMAVNLHGARRTTDDVDILLSAADLERFRQEMVPKYYTQVEGRPRRFRERKSGILLDILVTGKYPGSGKPGPFAFPHPAKASQEIKHIKVITLPQLVQLKLAARRYYDFGDVVHLIRVHNLDEAFLKQIHPSVKQDFIECLAEKRREDEYEARAD